jgi:hypothetical protein
VTQLALQLEPAPRKPPEDGFDVYVAPLVRVEMLSTVQDPEIGPGRLQVRMFEGVGS